MTACLVGPVLLQEKMKAPKMGEDPVRHWLLAMLRILCTYAG